MNAVSHYVVRGATPEHTLAVMARTAREAASTPAVREWAATLATKAPPRDYVGQLRELYGGIVERWRYVQEPDEWVHGTASSLLGTVAGVKYNGRHDPRSVNLARVPTRRKGWGDCDDVATLTAAGVRALGMRPYFRVTRGPRGAHVSVLARTPRGQVVSIDPVGHPTKPFGWMQPSSDVRLYDAMDAREVPSLSGDDAQGETSMSAMGCASCPPGPITAMGSFEQMGVTSRRGLSRGHMCAVPYGDIDGPRVLAVPQRYADMLAVGAVVEDIPAVDEMGNEYRYDARRDLWIDQRLNQGAMGATDTAQGGTKKKLSARERRRAKRRKFFKRVVKRIRGVIAKILSSKIAQNLVGMALQVYGVPRRLTVGVMAAAAEILKKGGLPALIRLIRKNPKAAMKLVAQAGKVALKKIAMPLSGEQYMARVEEPQALMVRQGDGVYYGAPVEMIVGVPGVASMGELEVSPAPRPGSWYKIKKGDTLLTVAGAAYGVPSGGTRLERAKWINSARANDPYFDPGLTDNLFKSGKISFSPKFASDPAQAIKGAPGKDFATIWIPAAKGDEPSQTPDVPESDDDDDLPTIPPTKPPIIPTIPTKPTLPTTPDQDDDDDRPPTIPPKPPIGPTIPPKPTKPSNEEFARACRARGGHVVTAAGGGIGCAICQPSERFDAALQRCVAQPVKPPIGPTIPPTHPPTRPHIPPTFPPTHPPVEPPKTASWLPLAAGLLLLAMNK